MSPPDGNIVPLVIGDRVQVYNPGPGQTGTIITNQGSGATHAHVRWDDDGTDGWAFARLLRRVTFPDDAA